MKIGQRVKFYDGIGARVGTVTGVLNLAGWRRRVGIRPLCNVVAIVPDVGGWMVTIFQKNVRRIKE